MRVLVISALFLSTHAMASIVPGLNILRQGNFAVSQPERQGPPEAPKSCVDFSGEWVGECTDSSGHVMASDLIIVQNQCGSLSFVNEEELFTVSIGVPFVYDFSKAKEDPMEGYAMGVIDWSPSFEELILPFATVMKFDLSPIMIHAKAKYFMDGDQLVVSTIGSTETVTDPSIPSPWSDTCIYNKIK